MFKVSIPKISDEEMLRRYALIKPVVRVNGKLHYFRKFTLEEITENSYLWNRNADIAEEVPEGELKVLENKDFVCLHGYGYPGFFKPSVGEVLSQISKHDIPIVRAFEIIEAPECVSDFSKDSFTSIAFDQGYHVSTVRLYTSKD